MPLFKNIHGFYVLLIIISLTIVLAACDLKVNLNSNLNQEQPVTDSEEPVDQQVEPEDSEDKVIYNVMATEEGLVQKVANQKDEIIIEDVAELCETEMMIYAQPKDLALIILKPFDPGSDKYLNQLFVLNLDKQTCSELEISQELTDFGAHILSPDQTKLAVALETDEARELKLLDLVYDKSLTLVELEKGRTLNGGYGAMSNQFNINWQGNQTIQYAIFKDTYENYDPQAPDEPEKILQVKVLEID